MNRRQFLLGTTAVAGATLLPIARKTFVATIDLAKPGADRTCTVIYESTAGGMNRFYEMWVEDDKPQTVNWKPLWPTSFPRSSLAWISEPRQFTDSEWIGEDQSIGLLLPSSQHA